MTLPVSMPPSVMQAAISVLERSSHSLHGDHQLGKLMASLFADGASGRSVQTGIRPRPFDFVAARGYFTNNAHHSTCILSKVETCVGLGFADGVEEVLAKPPAGGEGLVAPQVRTKMKDSKADELLNPLCMYTFADVLHDVNEDYFSVGNGYLEVVRESSSGSIVGLHYLDAATVEIEVVDRRGRHFFRIKDCEESVSDTCFARFGEYGDILSLGLLPEGEKSSEDQQTYSEVIHFRKPSSMSRWYGFPDWLAAVPSMELDAMITQQRFDFFLNRGVPEFIFALIGVTMSKDEWDSILATLQSHIGAGNGHKSLALKLPSAEAKIQVEHLAAETGEDTFGSLREALALTIVTAHRTPPLLAGIQIPGKLAAANELPNALMAYQALVIAPAQRVFQQTLGVTLGSEEAGLGLTVTDFTFRTITEVINPAQADTISRMKEPLASGRDPSKGLKD